MLHWSFNSDVVHWSDSNGILSGDEGATATAKEIKQSKMEKVEEAVMGNGSYCMAVGPLYTHLHS